MLNYIPQRILKESYSEEIHFRYPPKQKHKQNVLKSLNRNMSSKLLLSRPILQKKKNPNDNEK